MLDHALTTLAQFGRDATVWLPPQRSVMARDIDAAWNAVYIVMVVFFLIVVGAMTLFVIKYRRRSPADKVSTVTHNTPLEVIWTVIPLLIVLWLFTVGFKGFMDFDTAPTDAYPINVQASKWSFSFEYPNGGTSNVLYVPVNTDVRLVMTSKDVLHALYIPAFRISRNAIPQRTTELWFNATQVTDEEGLPIYCTQYCGDGHSQMFTKVVVLPKAEFEKKLLQLANVFKEGDRWLPYAEVGERLYKSAGCNQCHSVDGTSGIGPTWKGLWKRDHAFKSSDEPGYTLLASDSDQKWEAYIRESIVAPDAKIVDGYPRGVMSSFAGAFDGTEYKREKAKAIIEYIKKISLQDKYDPTQAPLYPENPEAKKAGAAASATSAPAR